MEYSQQMDHAVIRLERIFLYNRPQFGSLNM